MPGEDLLQYAWERQFLNRERLKSTCGKELEILRPGTRNVNAGPDFFNALIRVDRIIWAGNVEVHTCASDWFRHGHHRNPAYDNVILHVVKIADAEARTCAGRRILTTVPEIQAGNPSPGTEWPTGEMGKPAGGCNLRLETDQRARKLSLLQAERLYRKTTAVTGILARNRFEVEVSLYRAIGWGFGLPINTLPFGMVICSIPVHLLNEHRNSILDLEALLFGQAGLIPSGSSIGTYERELWQRYRVLSRNLESPPIPRHLWKFLRIRPASFPTLRLSQFASLVHRHAPLSETIFDASTITELEQLLRVGASPYWQNHYLFGKPSTPRDKHAGLQFVRSLIINVIVPFLNALELTGQHTGSISGARGILSSLHAESNNIIEKWSKFGVSPRNAWESQALIELYLGHCMRGSCTDCPFGQDP